jgi:hypothetical protein
MRVAKKSENSKKKKRNSENEEICLDIMISYVKFVEKN